MPATVVRGTQILDSTIQRDDVDISTVGNSLIRKHIDGSGIASTSTGADAGTGDVTVSLAATIPSGTVTQLYIGTKARFTALSNGLRLEIADSGGTWHTQQDWTQ